MTTARLSSAELPMPKLCGGAEIEMQFLSPIKQAFATNLGKLSIAVAGIGPFIAGITPPEFTAWGIAISTVVTGIGCAVFGIIAKRFEIKTKSMLDSRMADVQIREAEIKADRNEIIRDREQWMLDRERAARVETGIKDLKAIAQENQAINTEVREIVKATAGASTDTLPTRIAIEAATHDEAPK